MLTTAPPTSPAATTPSTTPAAPRTDPLGATRSCNKLPPGPQQRRERARPRHTVTSFVAYSSQEATRRIRIEGSGPGSGFSTGRWQRVRDCALVLVVLFAAACSAPISEAEAIDRLAATEAAVQPIIEAALGAEAFGVWERSEAPLGLFCRSSCVAIVSRLTLGLSHSAEVLDRFEGPARDSGARIGPVRTSSSRTTRNGTLISEEVTGWSRLITFDGDLYPVAIGVHAGTGELYAHIATGEITLTSDE
jgi:hypothetical protein